MSRFDIDGEWIRCEHCDGIGTQDGPGGQEPCCHCNGKGERFFDGRQSDDVEEEMSR